MLGHGSNPFALGCVQDGPGISPAGVASVFAPQKPTQIHPAAVAGLTDCESLPATELSGHRRTVGTVGWSAAAASAAFGGRRGP